MKEPIEDPQSNLDFAFLVDGDNAQATLLQAMLDEVSKHGRILIRRIYGDWNNPQMVGWRETLQKYGIKPIQQFPNRKGKNATDVALVIDAMDMLHAEDVNAFCIVASDSDYTSLAIRLREPGRFVMGMGRANTPEAFRNACDLFVYTENLEPKIETKPTNKSSETPKEGENEAELAPPEIEIEGTESSDSPTISPGRIPDQPPVPKPTAVTLPKLKPSDAVPFLIKAFEMVSLTDGWAHLANMGNALLRIDPAFDSRSYGQRSLWLLFQALPKVFEIKKTNPKGPSAIYVRLITKATG